MRRGGLEIALQLEHVPGIGVVEVAAGPAQRLGSERIGARRPPRPQVDPAGKKRLQSAALLSDDKRGWFGSMTPPAPIRMRWVPEPT